MKLTLFLITITILAYIIPLMVVPDTESFYNEYGFSFQNLPSKPWILVTSIFLHGSLEHLASNILVWLFFGMAVESEIGIFRYLFVFFAGAFLGDFASYFFYPPDTVFIGASAGIFSLIGIGMLVKPLDLSFYPLVIPIPLAFLGIAYILFNVYAFATGSVGNISYVGHLGGLAVGFLYGVKRVGVKRSFKIILISLLILALAPLVLSLII